MAGQDGRPPAFIKQDLLKNPRAYSFFQAVRLLRFFSGDARAGSEDRFFNQVVKIRTLLSLSFPGTDIYSLEQLPEEHSGRYRITATFLGLYGASSPMPTHYTEDLLDEFSDDETVNRDFLDVIGDPFYRLFFQVWTRNRWFIKLLEENDQAYYDRLYGLLGLGLPEFRSMVPRARGFLRYIGLFSQFPRSAMGLRALLSAAVDVPAVEVIPNVRQQVSIPKDQQCLLGIQGNTLGDECYLGELIDDRMCKIAVRIGPVDEAVFHQLLPDNPLHDDIVEATRLYLIEPLACDLELVLGGREARTATLGHPKWSALGYDTWTFSGPALEQESAVRFNLKFQSSYNH